MSAQGRPIGEYRSAKHEVPVTRRAAPRANTGARSAKVSYDRRDGRRLAVLVGASCAPFRDGIAAAVATPWDIVSISDDLSDRPSSSAGQMRQSPSITARRGPRRRTCDCSRCRAPATMASTSPRSRPASRCATSSSTSPACPNTRCSRCWNGAIGWVLRIAICGRASGPAPRASEAHPMTSSPARPW